MMPQELPFNFILDVHGVSFGHPQRCRIAHHVAARRVRWAGSHPATSQVSHKRYQFGNASRIRVVDDQFADARLK